MESVKWLVWSLSLWWSWRALAAVLSASSCTLSCSTPQYSGWAVKEVGLFGSIPAAGETWCSPMCLPRHLEKSWFEISFGTGSCSFGEGVIQIQQNCSSYLLRCEKSLSLFFFSIKVVCLNFSVEILDFYEVTLVTGWLSKSVYLGGRWQKTLISPLLLFFPGKLSMFLNLL